MESKLALDIRAAECRPICSRQGPLLLTCSIPCPGSLSVLPTKNSQKLPIDMLAGVAIALAAATITMVWYSFDARSLSADEAVHVLNSISAGDLLMRCKPWQYQWWYQCFTVSDFYPPFSYAVSGACIKLCQSVAVGEHLSKSVFMFALTAAIFAISKFLNISRSGALMSAACIAMYPIIAGLSHTAFLDMPAVAMSAVSIAYILWWRKTPSPCWKRTLFASLVTAAACLTKQTACAFILPVGIYFVLIDIRHLIRSRKSIFVKSNLSLEWLSHDACYAAATAIFAAPFFVINNAYLHAYLIRNVAALAAKGIHETFIGNLVAFCQLLPDAVSPLASILIIASVSGAKREAHLRLLPVSISGLGGMVILCMAPGIVHDYRYVMPVLISPAIYTGRMIGDMFASPKKIWQSIAVVVVATLCYAYFVLLFTPYPVKLPALPWHARFSYYCKPSKPVDWGYDAVIDTIARTGDRHVLLNVLANTDFIHINGYRLRLAQQHNFDILPGGSRFYTITGDEVSFSPEKALSFDWYLWKTGSTGYTFYDSQSAHAFDQLVDFVVKSGHYKMKLCKPLPDGTDLLLFRKEH